MLKKPIKLMGILQKRIGQNKRECVTEAVARRKWWSFCQSMGFSEEVQALESAQKIQFSQLDEEIEKEGLAVVQIVGSLTHLHDALMMKNDPDRQFLIPPVTFTLDNFHERINNNEFWLSP